MKWLCIPHENVEQVGNLEGLAGHFVVGLCQNNT